MKLLELNNVNLVGRVHQSIPIEFKYTKKGTPVCKFDIVVSRGAKKKGQWVTESDRVPIIAWRDIAEACMANLERGDPVFIHGIIKSNQWVDPMGKSHNKIEIVATKLQFLSDPKKKESDNDSNKSTTRGSDKKGESNPAKAEPASK